MYNNIVGWELMSLLNVSYWWMENMKKNLMEFSILTYMHFISVHRHQSISIIIQIGSIHYMKPLRMSKSVRLFFVFFRQLSSHLLFYHSIILSPSLCLCSINKKAFICVIQSNWWAKTSSIIYMRWKVLWRWNVQRNSIPFVQSRSHSHTYLVHLCFFFLFCLCWLGIGSATFRLHYCLFLWCCSFLFNILLLVTGTHCLSLSISHFYWC